MSDWDAFPLAEQSKPSSGGWDAFPLAGKQQTGSVMDVIKSAPRALLGGLSDTLAATGNTENIAMSQPQDAVLTKENTLGSLEKGVTGELYKPQTAAGRISSAGIEQLANPLTYLGPGSAALKVGGGILSGAGGEAGQELTGSPYGRIAGALAGGIGAAKTLGPSVERAAIPTAEELKNVAAKGYDAARNSGLELSPQGIAQFATQAEQKLTGPKYGFTGGSKGTAGGTLDLLDELKSAPPGSTVTASNLDTLRQNIGRIASETQDFKPTQNAKAAMVLKRDLENYMENIPQNHVVAGNPTDYTSAIRQANGDYAAAMRTGKVGDKMQVAANNADGGIATAIDNQQKSGIRQILNKPKAQRGFSEDEIAQMGVVNKGTVPANIFRQLGRGGTGVVPMGAHAATAYATGGASIPAQLGLAVPLYASKKIAEALNTKQVNKLDEMLRMRSPEYASRVAKIKPTDTSANKAAIVRALLGATQ